MEYFEKAVDGFELLTILGKRSILDIWQGSKYGSAADTYSRRGKKLCNCRNHRGYSKAEISSFLVTVCSKEYFLITSQICEIFKQINTGILV